MSETVAVAGSSKLPADWRVSLPVFEGPLDLLLELVRVNEVEITDIPVALVCDQFHEYLELMEELDLDIAAEYIYEAALLIQLKSRILLPVPEEADAPQEDPREDLIRRLLEYERLKEAAATLAETDSVRSGMWPAAQRTSDLRDDDEPAVELEEVSMYDLLLALNETLERFRREHPQPLHYPVESFPVRAQFERLLERAQHGRPFDVLDDLLSLSCRAEAVAAFLALLELSRLQLIRLHQSPDGGGILLYRTTRQLAAADLETIQG